MKVTRRQGFTLLELVVVVAILVVLASLIIMKTGGVRDNAEAIAARSRLHTVREAFTGSPSAVGYLADLKYVPGFNSLSIRTHDLLSSSSYAAFTTYDPVANRGWRGPYIENAQGAANTIKARNGAFPLSSDIRFKGDSTYLARHFFTDATTSPYATAGDLVVADPWGNPIVVQVPPGTAFSTPTDAKRFRYARIVSAGPDGILSTPLDDRLGGMLPDGTTAARGDDLVIFLNRTDTYEVEEP